MAFFLSWNGIIFCKMGGEKLNFSRSFLNNMSPILILFISFFFFFLPKLNHPLVNNNFSNYRSRFVHFSCSKPFLECIHHPFPLSNPFENAALPPPTWPMPFACEQISTLWKTHFQLFIVFGRIYSFVFVTTYLSAVLTFFFFSCFQSKRKWNDD